MSENQTAAEVKIIAVSKERLETVKASFDNTTDVITTKFHFKKVKALDSEGKETGIESKRPSLEIPVPRPSVEGIIAILEAGGKQLDLLMEAVFEVPVSRARELINEDENLTADNFPYDKLTWEAIANLPKAERRGGGISKESWEEFAKDYIAVMPGVTGKTAEQVGNASKIFTNRFNSVKFQKPILKLLKAQLAIYTDNSPNAEQFTDVIEFLNNKADSLLSMDESQFAANL
jgi:hypothetical protein